jgi:hypothetical protein
MGSFLGLYASSLSLTLDRTIVSVVPFIVTVGVGFIIVVPAILFRKRFFYRRRLKRTSISAEYEAPLELNPAEIGYLFDGKLRNPEVGAVIIHMVQRGYLHMKKVDGLKRIYAGPRVDSAMKTYEKKLFDEADRPEGVTAEQLLGRFTSRAYHRGRSVSFGTKEFIFSQLVHTDLKKRGYVKSSYVPSFLWASAKIMVLLEIILIVIPCASIFLVASLELGTIDPELLVASVLLTLRAVLITSIPLMVFAMIIACMRGRILGREWIITEKLERLWPQIVGYKQYIQLVEGDKLRYNSTQLEKTIRNDTLPYAVALGYVKNWRNIIN